MLDSLKHWLARGTIQPDWRPISAWAKAQGYLFKGVRDSNGFVIDGNLQGKPWRLEWGPPQRAYIRGHELRLRMDVQFPPGLQMMVLTRPLMDKLENDTFERYTETLQTQIDETAPEEMRWLAMFPKVDLSLLKPMRGRFGAVSSLPSMASAWVDGLLLTQLEQASLGLLAGEPPFVLMTLRGRVYLRLELPEAELSSITQCIALFEAAVVQASRAAEVLGEVSTDWPTSSLPAWPSQLNAGPSTGSDTDIESGATRS
jgi:hypothetical protein